MVGKRIRLIRTIKGLKQIQLAQVMGVDQSTVSRMEQGRSEVTLEQAQRLLPLLGCTLEDLTREGGDLSVRITGA